MSLSFEYIHQHMKHSVDIRFVWMISVIIALVAAAAAWKFGMGIFQIAFVYSAVSLLALLVLGFISTLLNGEE